MKFLQKATLAAAIAAAPFAAQALQPIGDSELGGVTGQAGVTIEIDINASGISVGEVEYTDTRAAAAPLLGDFTDIPGGETAQQQFDKATAAYQNSGGSVLLQNITVKNVSGLTQTIDVNEDGDLVMGVGAVDNVQIAIGEGAANSALALKSADGAVAEVVNDISMQVDLGPQTTYIRNLAGRDAGEINGLGLPSAAAGGSVAIQQTMAVRLDDLSVGAFGYTQAQAVTVGTGLSTALAGGTSEEQAGAKATIDELIAKHNAANSGANVALSTAGTALTTDQQNAVNGQIADGSAIGIKGVEFYKAGAGTDGVLGTNDDTKEYATITQNIWAKGGSAATGGGLYIQVGQIDGTLAVGGIELGGTSIGSVKVSDINLAGMTQRIYGHQ